MTYIPEEYWHTRGGNYVAPGEIDEAPEVENLKTLLFEHNLLESKVLEVGAGYGRIYQELNKMLFITKPLEYSMCDFVESMRYNCLRRTGKLPELWDGKELPYNDGEFDLVISFSVLLHVTPDMIEQVLREHARVTRRFIFVATYAGGLDVPLAPHCFEHDYAMFFRLLNLDIVNFRVFQNGIRANWLLSV